MSDRQTIRPQLALEMTMRDVLGNMEEMVGAYGLRDLGGEFEILSIEAAAHHEPPCPESRATRIRPLYSAEVLPLASVTARVA